MSNQTCEIDVSHLERIIDGLDDQARHNIIMQGLKAGGKTLVQLAKESLLRKVPTANQPTQKGGFKGKKMTDGIKQTVDEALTTVIVSVMRDARNIWFEDGTVERKLLRTGAKDYERGTTKGRYYRKEGSQSKYPAGANRGRVKATHFFQEARQSEQTSTEIIRKMTEAFEKAINKQ